MNIIIRLLGISIFCTSMTSLTFSLENKGADVLLPIFKSNVLDGMFIMNLFTLF